MKANRKVLGISMWMNLPCRPISPLYPLRVNKTLNKCSVTPTACFTLTTWWVLGKSREGLHYIISTYYVEKYIYISDVTSTEQMVDIINFPSLVFNAFDMFTVLLLYNPLLGIGRFSVSWSYTPAAGLLGRGISPSQGLYLNIGQHKCKRNTYTPNIHALSGIRTHNPSVRVSEDSSCLRPRGYRDQCLKP
jgi:hypothetical protein